MKSRLLAVLLALLGIVCLAQQQPVHSQLGGCGPTQGLIKPSCSGGGGGGCAGGSGTVAFDDKSLDTLSGGGVTTATNSSGNTVGAGLVDGILIGSLMQTGGGTSISAPSMTWAGAAMGLVASSTAGAGGAQFLFAKRNPASGANSLVANWTTAAQVDITWISFQHVDPTSDACAVPPANVAATSGTSTVASVTVTAAATDFAIAVHSTTTSSGTLNQTIWFSQNGGAVYGIGGNYGAGPNPTLTDTISSAPWASLGIDLAHD